MSLFFTQQSLEAQQEYRQLLQAIGALSNLFSDSKSPYLHYRIMENMFCKAFDADNLSRSDVSVDAAKNGVGVGLKTFLHEKGNTLQKIAEFNKKSDLFRGKTTNMEIIRTAAELRNERISFTNRTYGLSHSIYHLITRSPFQMTIYEEPMDPIDLDSLEELVHSTNTLHFRDQYHEYSLSLSKSTLYKRFFTTEEQCIQKIPLEILKDPYELLLKQQNFLAPTVKKSPTYEQTSLFTSGIWELVTPKTSTVEDYIVLPLYSPSSGIVHERSGLNMWNAKGRIRDENEVYLPIPRWIHEKKDHFFPYKEGDDPYKSDSFLVKLPNGKELSLKVTQQFGKALQSSPNAALGQWILREVLEVPVGHLVTSSLLDHIGIDSVQLSRHTDGSYTLDFLQTGSFESYRDEMFLNS